MKTISAQEMRDRMLAALKRGTLLLEDKRPIKRVEIRVPAGYELPFGTKVERAFTLIVEAGVRWHPDWDEPRVTVNGWRFFPLGDALCLAGEELVNEFGDLLPEEIKTLAAFHGKQMSHLGDYGREAVETVRLVPPTEKQALASFIMPEQRGTVH